MSRFFYYSDEVNALIPDEGYRPKYYIIEADLGACTPPTYLGETDAKWKANRIVAALNKRESIKVKIKRECNCRPYQDQSGAWHLSVWKRCPLHKELLKNK
jgi:hypothetical protein